MKQIPKEIISEIIKYFRGYENDEKRLLELGEKEEHICRIMNNKFVEIIHNIMELRDNHIDNIRSIETEIDELINGKIGINNIDIRRDYNISYSKEEEKLIDEIMIEIDFFKKKFNSLRQRYCLYHFTMYKDMKYIVKRCKLLYNKFKKIAKSENNTRYLVIERIIYENIIEVYLGLTEIIQVKNYTHNKELYIDTKLLKFYLDKIYKVIIYYRDIYTYTVLNHSIYIIEKQAHKEILKTVSHLYKQTKIRYGYDMVDPYNTLTKMLEYYQNIPIANSNFLYVIADELEYVMIINFNPETTRCTDVPKFDEIKYNEKVPELNYSIDYLSNPYNDFFETLIVNTWL